MLQLQLCPLHGYFYTIQYQSISLVSVAITAYVEEFDSSGVVFAVSQNTCLRQPDPLPLH